MFISINDLRDACALMVEIIDEREMLLRENIKLREQIDANKEWQKHMYEKSCDSIANILNNLTERSNANDNFWKEKL